MSQLKKMLAVFLSAVLTFSLMGVSAYARSADENPLGDHLEVTDDTPMATESQSTTEDVVSGAEAPQVNDEAGREATADKSVNPTITELPAAEAVDFVYIESSVLPVGETQYIMVGLKADATVSAASISLIKTEAEEPLQVDALGISENSALFTKAFISDEDIAGYLLSSITYTVENQDYLVDFGNGDMTSVALVEDEEQVDEIGAVDVISTDVAAEPKAAYAFDVVSKDLADTLAQGSDDTTVIAMTDDSEMVTTETVEEAIELVDADSADGSVKEMDPSAVSPEINFTDGSDGANAIEAGTPVNASNPDGSEAFVQPTDENGYAIETYDAAGSSAESDEAATDEPEEKSWFSSIIDFFVNLFTPGKAWGTIQTSLANAREDYLVVAIDPGHGGSDPGACANDIQEKNVNLKIAQYFRDELNTYTGVTPYLTRDKDVYVGLQERVNRAVTVGAHVFVSVHNNSGGGRGSEVWVPNNSSYLNSTTRVPGWELGNKIESRIVAITGKSHGDGVKSRNSETNNRYSDGSMADYYSVIYNSRLNGIPGIIVEHAFLDNTSDAALLKNESKLKEFGVADASGVADQYNLIKADAAKAQSLVAVQAHMQNLGWEREVYDGKVAGLTGKERRLESFKAYLTKGNGGIQYRVNGGSGWENWVDNNAEAGFAGQSKGVQAIQMRLTGAAANQYDVYYRSHVAHIGWLDWAKNEDSSGSHGYGYNIEAIQVKLVPKGGSAPGSTSNAFAEPAPSFVNYSTHVQDIGWQTTAQDGGMAGTTGKGLRLEAIKLSLGTAVEAGGIEYRTHVQNLGWQDWKYDGEPSGTEGKQYRLEAIQIQLTGAAKTAYDVYYRVHAENYGWLGWATNGQYAGTSDHAYRLEGIEVVLKPKNEAGPQPQSGAYKTRNVLYCTHVQDQGWQQFTYDGNMSGTSGKSLRLEGIKLWLGNDLSGGIEYRTHIQNIGWESGWKSNQATSGTSGRELRLEAIQIRLTGKAADTFDVYYRVHAQHFGWMGWAKNGENAGTAGFSYRLEGIQVQLVKKGEPAPNSSDCLTNDAFCNKDDSAIMGTSKTSAPQLARYYTNAGKTYPAWYASNDKEAKTLNDFCKIYMEEATLEGVRAEVAFCQAMHETGWLEFGGTVLIEQKNFAGIGTVNASTRGAYFSTVREGIRAQIQHLKAYASTASLVNPQVDPRFHLVTRGCAPYMEDLNGKWAVPGTNYGQSIMTQVRKCLVS